MILCCVIFLPQKRKSYYNFLKTQLQNRMNLGLCISCYKNTQFSCDSLADSFRNWFGPILTLSPLMQKKIFHKMLFFTLRVNIFGFLNYVFFALEIFWCTRNSKTVISVLNCLEILRQTMWFSNLSKTGLFTLCLFHSNYSQLQKNEVTSSIVTSHLQLPNFQTQFDSK